MVNFMLLLLSADFFSKQIFQKILSGIQSKSNSLDPDQAQHFVRPVQGPVCKGYQQTTLVGKELSVIMVNFSIE